MNDIDPELVEDEVADEAVVEEVELPDYDPSQFELDEDFEYTDEWGDDDGSEDEE